MSLALSLSEVFKAPELDPILAGNFDSGKSDYQIGLKTTPERHQEDGRATRSRNGDGRKIIDAEEKKVDRYETEMTRLKDEIEQWVTDIQSIKFSNKLTFDFSAFNTKYDQKPNIGSLQSRIQEAYEKYQSKIKPHSGALKDIELFERHWQVLKAYKTDLLNYTAAAKKTLDSMTEQKLLQQTLNERIKLEKPKLATLKRKLTQIDHLIFDWIGYVDSIHAKAQFIDPLCMTTPTCNIVKDSIIIKRKVIQDSISILKFEIDSTMSAYLSEVQNYRAYNIFKDAKELEKQNDNVAAIYNSMLDILEKAGVKINSQNTAKLISLAASVVNHHSNEYRSLPMQLMGDEAKLILTIAPRDSHSRLDTYSTKISFPRHQKHFFGVASGFYVSKLYDEAFSTIAKFDPILEDTVYTVVPENITDFEAGLFLTMNLGKTFGSKHRRRSWGAGISFGPALSFTKKLRPRMIWGANVSYGKRSKLTLGLGGILGHVDRRSQAIPQGQNPFTSLPESIVVSRLKHRFALSLGYIYTL